MRLSIRDMCIISVCTAMVVGVSQLAVPLAGGVPITLQTFAIALSGVVLGAKKGAVCAVVYVLLGAIGLPVFTGFMGGFHRLIGPTGGFIISFPFMAFVIGYYAEKNKAIWLVLGLAIGVVVNLSMGTLQFAFVTGNSLPVAFTMAMAPFIVVEMVKMAFVFVVGTAMRKVLVKSGLLTTV